MKEALEQYLEDSFDFTAFQRLTGTRDAIMDGTGKILYVPTDLPVPFDKRVLSAIVDSDDVRVLSMPVDEWEFQETIYTGIDYLVNNDGDGTVVFFCPRFLVDGYQEIPGTSFVHFERVQLDDPTRTIRSAFERGAGTEPQPRTIDDLAEFALRAFTAAATGAELNPTHIQTSTDDQLDDFYIPYDTLSSVPTAVREFFLDSIGIPNTELFDSLEPTAQQNVYTPRLLATYGDRFAQNEPKYPVAAEIQDLDPDLQRLYRTLITKWLAQRRLFDATLTELATVRLDRDVIDTIQESYQEITGQDTAINIQEPEHAAEILTQHFGILFHTVDEDEFTDLVNTVRDQLSSDSHQIEDYGPDQALNTVEKVDSLLQLLAEVALIKHPRFVNAAFPEDRWADIFQKFLHVVYENDREDLLAYRYLTALNQARKQELREREAEDLAEDIRTQEVELDTLPHFLDQWASFLADTREEEPVSDLLQQELIDKYDSYCAEVVDRYDEIVSDDEWLHLSDLLTAPEDGRIKLTVILDSVGYTDYLLLNQFGFLNTEPDDVDLAFSNLPSYTPSAISTILTGLPAETTGIYSWQPRHGDDIFNLKHSSYDPDAFDFVDERTENNFHLIQRPQLNSSGISRFADQVADIRFSSDLSIEADHLGAVRRGFVNEVESTLNERHHVLNTDDVDPEARAAQRSQIVLYLEDFDKILHEMLSFEEFENYYNTLGNFLDNLLADLREATDTIIEEPIDIEVISDHGKLTRYEMEMVLNERPEYEFNQQMLTETVPLQHAYRVNFREAEFTNRSDHQFVTVATDENGPPVDRIRAMLTEEDANDVSDDALRDVTEKVEYLQSGSKFVFGWHADSDNASLSDLRQFDGVDVYQPRGDGIFDLPDVGLLSRYDIKNRSGHDHGYHGGTSISEMAGLRLIYEDE
ncbi:alkaline phosphatase family protein [Natrinema halophilum]|uniref:Alkaline phosphatase family protein n=1 Tax=Natrinema halophilum TaxID=1699371 RepID=A0A7D5H4I4_9EURY|nr:alkaline phosphatase family protein [Natrinema halophilum]QLG50651.1 alkaline phosphatase family protein [Natrinema halophilum]